MTVIPSNNFEAGSPIPRAEAGVEMPAALDLLRRDGVLVIDRLLDETCLAKLDEECRPWFDAAFTGSGPLFGHATKRFAGLFAKLPSAADLALHPLILSLMEAVLRGTNPEQPNCDSIELNLTQAIGIGPGEPPQFLHRDEELWPFQHDFEIMANAMWTLDEFTPENGATRVIPGSHLWPRDRLPQPGETVPAAAPPGSVILWLGGVLHGGGANLTNGIRRGIVMSYRMPWISPMEKLLLSTPPDVARTLPERLQRLIGYQIHRPNLGWVEGQDPIRWLRGEFGSLAPCEDNLAPQHEELLAAVQANPSAYAGYIS
jgi:Phytanoyl-CoA dioxygenase (PhyH)